MATVQVNAEDGNSIGRVKVGESVLIALLRLQRDGCGGLYDNEDLGLLEDEIITAEGSPYVFKQQQLLLQQSGSMIRFQSLLASKGITPSQPVMMQFVKNFASSVAIVSDAEIVAALYYSAARLLRSATELVLKDQGISVAHPFKAADPSRAILLHAFRDGYPMILKVSSSASVKHEAEVINGMTQTGDFDLSEKHLCPIEVIQFASDKIELTDTIGSISTAVAGARQGLLMKHYQTTLAQCKIPLAANVLLKYGKQHKIAISHIHQMGYCHLDIKPANIFLLEGDCFLGDYGAATKIGWDTRNARELITRLTSHT